MNRLSRLQHALGLYMIKTKGNVAQFFFQHWAHTSEFSSWYICKLRSSSKGFSALWVSTSILRMEYEVYSSSNTSTRTSYVQRQYLSVTTRAMQTLQCINVRSICHRPNQPRYFREFDNFHRISFKITLQLSRFKFTKRICMETGFC